MALTLRQDTVAVKVGSVTIGGGSPVSIQSMTNTDTRDIQSTLDQIRRLVGAGCEIVRLAVLDEAAAESLARIRRQVQVPLVADIHFSHKLALLAIEGGVDKLRINPGNIGSHDKVREVVRAAIDHGVPIRIGVNSGSVEKDLLRKYGRPSPDALVESALGHVAILESLGFDQIVISLKSSSIPDSIESYVKMAERVRYPLHVGITEAGGVSSGTIKSAVGIGAILSRGIGDTVRVSLTGDPVEEVRVARAILNGLGLRHDLLDIISCPTCGRTQVDLEKILGEVERRLSGLRVPLKVAVMGCVVNGPGEAREADYGIACGRGSGVVFKGGSPLRTVTEEGLVDALIGEIMSDPRVVSGSEPVANSSEQYSLPKPPESL